MSMGHPDTPHSRPLDDEELDKILTLWENWTSEPLLELVLRGYLKERMNLRTQKPLFPPGVMTVTVEANLTMAVNTYEELRRWFDELSTSRSPDRARPHPAKRAPKHDRRAGRK